jgi:hypothetical protein
MTPECGAFKGAAEARGKAKVRSLLILLHNLFIYLMKVTKAFVIWDNGLFSAATRLDVAHLTFSISRSAVSGIQTTYQALLLNSLYVTQTLLLR